jgi:tetratricopeptide (TPR) repeat protein
VAVGAALLQTAVVVLAVSVLLIGRSRSQIDRERRRAEAVNAFLVRDLLAQADPRTNPEGAKLTVRELLDKAAAAVETSPSVKQNPEVEGAVRAAIGNAYFGLGLYQRAREELELAVACQDRVPDVPASERIFSKNRLCWAIYKLGDFDETMAREVLAQARAALGPDHEETVYAADTLATITMANGRRREAFALYRENLTTQQRVLGPEHPLTIRAALSLCDGLMSNQQGDRPENLDEALAIMLATRDACHHAFKPDNPERLYYENVLGFLYARLGKCVEARDVLAPLREPFLKVFGPDHIDVGLYCENFALAEEGLGHLDAAEALLHRSYAIRKSAVGEGHGLTRRAAMHLGRVCMAQGKTEEAVAWLRVLMTAGVTEARRLATPARTPEGGVDVGLLGDALSEKGDPETSDDLLEGLCVTLNWLAWRTDWLRSHARSLRCAVMWRRRGLANEEIARELHGAVKHVDESVKDMEANPATPPRILEGARARLQRLKEAAAQHPLPP